MSSTELVASQFFATDVNMDYKIPSIMTRDREETVATREISDVLDLLSNKLPTVKDYYSETDKAWSLSKQIDIKFEENVALPAHLAFGLYLNANFYTNQLKTVNKLTVFNFKMNYQSEDNKVYNTTVPIYSTKGNIDNAKLETTWITTNDIEGYSTVVINSLIDTAIAQKKLYPLNPKIRRAITDDGIYQLADEDVDMVPDVIKCLNVAAMRKPTLFSKTTYYDVNLIIANIIVTVFGNKKASHLALDIGMKRIKQVLKADNSKSFDADTVASQVRCFGYTDRIDIDDINDILRMAKSGKSFDGGLSNKAKTAGTKPIEEKGSVLSKNQRKKLNRQQRSINNNQ